MAHTVEYCLDTQSSLDQQLFCRDLVHVSGWIFSVPLFLALLLVLSR